jgi:tetratricopeptide (TPR) repeat protein
MPAGHLTRTLKHRPERRPVPAGPRRGPSAERWLPLLLLVLAVGIFSWHASTSAFLQDDSFITYRYARNVARGIGPVFNPGERVEGYTNFLWMMLLATLAIVGLPFSTIIPLSQVIGVIAGAGIIIIFFLLLRRHSRGPPLATPIATLLLAVNGAFAYWCVSGMETALFSLLLIAAAWYWLKGQDRPRDIVTASALLGLAALTRPEGAMFAALFGLHFVIRHLASRTLLTRPALSRLGLLALPFLALVLPLYAWRLAYYGYLFPNTFYAKTGASTSYLKTGVEYAWGFLKAYGLWGAALAVPVALAGWKRRLLPRDPLFFCLLLLVAHALYVVWVGGDVLRIWRFFVPVLFLFYFLLGEGVWLLRLPRAAGAVLLIALLPLTYFGPFTRPRTVRQDIARNLRLEQGLVDKMSATGRWLNARLGEDDWFACTTIGAVSWHSDRNMVDMLGLTDAMIAHHPEAILQSEWHWKERNYNTAHVLGRRPAYVYFSTGIKPSAEAERALFLRPRFRRGYFACPVTIVERQDGQLLHFTETVYKARPGNDTIPLEPVAEPSGFINRYLDGINLLNVGPDTAAALFRRCIEQAPGDFGAPWEWLGRIEQDRRRPELAERYYREALERDDWLINSHLSLAGILYGRGDIPGAARHLARIVEYAPDYLDGYTGLYAMMDALGDSTGAADLLARINARFPEAARLAR